MNLRLLRCLIPFFAATPLLGCNALEPPVMRSVDGVVTEGRFIEPEAYAVYAVAALREARGQHSAALTMYTQALSIDGHGPEIRTRIGAVACKLRQADVADKAFAAALHIDPEYGPAWFELALCRQRQGNLKAAQEAALEAVRLDPERFETSLLAADLAEARGDLTQAFQLRDALLTHVPDSIQAGRAILAAATRSHDKSRILRARTALEALAERRSDPRRESDVTSALAALERGDVEQAKLAASALLGAEPGNGDALVVALVVADLEQDHDGFARLLEAASGPGTRASPQVLRALSALLARRVSAQAAQLLQSQP
jgi:tetratricopeptide (TPR) repeat protein